MRRLLAWLGYNQHDDDDDDERPRKESDAVHSTAGFEVQRRWCYEEFHGSALKAYAYYGKPGGM